MTDTSPLVLVAEDEDELRTLIARSLGQHGLRVVELEDGLEMSDYIALARPTARHRIPLPSLVVTDVRMPGASGLEVVRAIRALGLDVPVVVLTAYPDDEVYEEALKLGDTQVFAKPFDLDELAVIVRDRVNRSRPADLVPA